MDSNKDIFVLIPLVCLKQMWNKGWSFTDLFHIGILISAYKANNMSIREDAFLLWKYGYHVNYKTHDGDCWNNVKEEIAKAWECLTVGGEFEIEESLSNYLKSCDNNIVMLWCKVVRLILSMHMDINKSFNILNNALEKYEICKDEVEPTEWGGYLDMPPYILMSSSIMKNIIASDKNSNDSYRMQRMMYMGIISIVGKSPFSQTTSDMIKARMFGFLTPEKLKEYYDQPEHGALRLLYDKYTTRRRYDYMLQNLQIDGLIGEIGYKRKTILSLRIKRPADLLRAVEGAAKTRKREELIEQKKMAIEKFRQEKNGAQS